MHDTWVINIRLKPINRRRESDELESLLHRNMMRKLSIASGKVSRLVLKAGRKVVLKPGEALLLCRMALWVSILSVTAKCCSLPRALQIVSGGGTITSHPSKPNTEDRLARTLDLLLSADVLFFKPICWKRAAHCVATFRKMELPRA